ncbi:MAG: alkaline phosphatase family protein [Candidatus Geothermarchaeales archaeon]
MKKMPETNRVMLIGLDGATSEIIKLLVGKGRLPTFERMMKHGCFGELTSVVPPLSAPAWASLATGKNPGKHGVYDFMTSYISDGSLEVVINNSGSIRGMAMWDILSNADKKVIVQNVPLTFPCYRVNGVMIAGFPSPLKGFTTYPPGLASTLGRRHKDYSVEVTYLKSEYKGLDEEKFAREVDILLQKHLEVTLDLLESYEWDFFMLVYSCLDRIQHMLWRYTDPSYSATDEKAERFRGVIHHFYRRADSILERICQRLPSDAFTIVVSDHGFEPLHSYAGLNNWLAQKGLLRVKPSSRIFSSSNVDEIYRSLYYHLNKLGLLRVIRFFPFGAGLNLLRRMKALSERIDFDESAAYSLHYGGISINDDYLRGRGEDPTKLEDFIIGELYRLKDPMTKGRLVEKIYRREEIYSGSLLERAPNLIVVFRGGCEPKRWTRGTVIEPNEWVPSKSVVSGAHHSSGALHGILLVNGPQVRHGGVKANIVDVAPTILHILGVPIPLDVDGRVLKEIFEEDSWYAEKEVAYQEAVGERERIRETVRRLRGLGRF